MALSSLPLALPRLRTFVRWLHDSEVHRDGAITQRHLDAYLHTVLSGETSLDHKAAMLIEVRRLWAYRDRVPALLRLPAAPPWNGDRPREILGIRRTGSVNRTPRIDPDTIEPLLLWAVRFVEDFATDITAAFTEHSRLRAASSTVGPPHGAGRRGIEQVLPDLRGYLARLRAGQGELPGRRQRDGTLHPDWAHLTRLFNAGDRALQRIPQLRTLIDASGLPIADAPYLDTPITGRIDGRPWRTSPISYHEAPALATMLRTACFITIAYLSGMRTGETLNLRRGCLTRDPDNDLWLITGRTFKAARDEDGNKIPHGEIRRDPWVVAQQAAHAIEVLQTLHPNELLFPAVLEPRPANRTSDRIGTARDPSALTRDIATLVTWVNRHAEELGREHEVIPEDSHGTISPSRFRRTLAWHIVRRPRGLVAGAIQYGHLHVQMTLGYSGSYDSGFPDDHAFEDWLHRLERLANDHQRLVEGEHISGPAADTYRERTHDANQQFAGRVLATTRQARDMLANPTLQIYPGRAVTCVFDPAKALCQLRRADDEPRETPDVDDCRTDCQNRAYTDRDIDELRKRLDRFQQLLGDFLAPSPRHARIRAERDRLRRILHDHERRRS